MLGFHKTNGEHKLPIETDQAGDFIEALGAERDSSDVKWAVRIEVMMLAVMHCYLKEALVLHRGADLIRARFVIQLHLNSIISPSKHKIVVGSIVNLKVIF